MTNDNRHRILHVISTLEGGAGRGAIEMVRELQGSDRYCVRLCVLGAPRPDTPTTGYDWITFLNCPVRFRSTTAKRLIRLRGLIRSWKPSLIHSHLWPSAVTVGLVSPRRIPHLIHIRDTPPSLTSPRFGSRMRLALSRKLFSRSNVRFVAVSQAAADYSMNALKFPSDRFTTVLNGVDLDRFLAVPDRPIDRPPPFIASCAGRLIPDKGFEDILRAIKHTELPPDSLMLRVAGEGSLLQNLKVLALDLGIADQVTFAGQVADMPDFFKHSDVFIHNAIAAEGLSRSILEAMGAGCAVISSDHAGAREAINDGDTGFIVPIHAPSAISTTIQALIRTPSLLRKISAAARSDARTRFSIHRVTRRITEIYNNLIGPAPK